MCAIDDLSFYGDDDSGCKTIPIGDGAEAYCKSESTQNVTWWHDEERVPQYPSWKPVDQNAGQLYFHYSATVDDSGNYYCRSPYDEKLLKVYIVGR